MTLGLRKTVRRKLISSISPIVPQQNIAAIETTEDQQSQWDSQRVVDLAQRKGTLHATALAKDNFPEHRSFASNGFGQYLRFVSAGVGSHIMVEHDLGAQPQGIIWIKQPTGPTYLVMVASTASGGYATSARIAMVIMAGPANEEAIGIIF